MIRAQFVVYLIVGLLSAIIDIGVMQIALWLDAGVNMAVTLGYAVGLIFNYRCHQRVTFKAASTAETMVRYGIFVLINYLLTLAFVFGSVYWLDQVMPGKLAALPVVAITGFLGGKYWIFHHPK